MLYVLIILTICILGAYVFQRQYPSFGGQIKGSRAKRVAQSSNHVGHTFVNTIATPMGMKPSAMLSLIRDQLTNAASRRPCKQLEPCQPDPELLASPDGAYVTWLGHSAFLVRLNGKTILLDPMLSKTASPVQAIGPKRFDGTPALHLKQLPTVDAVVISHDHYDHLDYITIKALAGSVKQFFVPLGVGAHLERWGVPLKHINELDWWESAVYTGISFICTPSRHFSGRKLSDRFATLWASWVIQTNKTKLYFSGDTGYGPHFAQIGQKYGPFDLTMLECGQYDRRWPTVHMLPEDTVRAHQDLGGKRMVPMHWGSFVLALHAWAEPVERATLAATTAGLEITTPELGQTFAVHSKDYPHTTWWKKYQQ